MILNIFPYAYLLSVHPLWWNDSSDPLLIFQLYCFFSVQLRIESLVYILDATPFINMWLTDISQSVACFSFLFTRSSTGKNFLILMRFKLSIFFFHELCFWCSVKKFIAKLSVTYIFSHVSARNLIVLHFLFRFYDSVCNLKLMNLFLWFSM